MQWNVEKPSLGVGLARFFILPPRSPMSELGFVSCQRQFCKLRSAVLSKVEWSSVRVFVLCSNGSRQRVTSPTPPPLRSRESARPIKAI